VNDTDTTILDARIKDLVNSAVDVELTGHRSAPPLDLSRLAERPSPHPVAAWSVPLLAATVAALLAIGTMLIISSDRDRRSDPDSTSPTPSISKSIDPGPNDSVTWCPHPGPRYATPTTLADVPDAPEATEVPGVSVGPVSAEDAASTYAGQSVKFTGSAGPFVRDFRDLKPVPGKSYSFTLKYVVPEAERSVSALLIVLRDVAAGSCPRPFLVRPGHTYLIRCEMTFLPESAGQLVITTIGSSGWGEMVLPLSGEVGDLAGIPEASKVAGVSVGPVSEQDDADLDSHLGQPYVRDFNGVKDYSGKPTPGKSYPFTVKYVVSRFQYPVSVVSMTFQDVASGSCPEPFLARADHTYLIRCRITFRAGAAGKLTLVSRTPAFTRDFGHLVKLP
jgi:hypothetical protein